MHWICSWKIFSLQLETFLYSICFFLGDLKHITKDSFNNIFVLPSSLWCLNSQKWVFTFLVMTFVSLTLSQSVSQKLRRRECKKVQQCLLCKPGGNKTKNQNKTSRLISVLGQRGEPRSFQPRSGNSHSHTVILSTSRELALDRIRHFMMVSFHLFVWLGIFFGRLVNWFFTSSRKARQVLLLVAFILAQASRSRTSQIWWVN